MTQEEKLLQLLEKTVENGWSPLISPSSDCLVHWLEQGRYFQSTIVIEGLTIVCYPINTAWPTEYISLDQLVNHWEEGEVSFIGALCSTIEPWLLNGIIDLSNKYIPMYESGNNFEYFHGEETIRMLWSNTPSSKRLEELFRIFNHLLKTED